MINLNKILYRRVMDNMTLGNRTLKIFWVLAANCQKGNEVNAELDKPYDWGKEQSPTLPVKQRGV
jgi:hypothetical protein